MITAPPGRRARTGSGYGNRVRRYLQPGFVVAYGVVTAIFVVAVIFFGWFGFWLGLAVLALVKVARWGIPLIKLSYQRQPPAAEERVVDDVSGEPADAAR